MESFFLSDAKVRVGEDSHLIKLNKLIDWPALRKPLKGFHKNEDNPKGGQYGYDLLKMLKASLLGQ